MQELVKEETSKCSHSQENRIVPVPLMLDRTQHVNSVTTFSVIRVAQLYDRDTQLHTHLKSLEHYSLDTP
jgi:hypothetical protein